MRRIAATFVLFAFATGILATEAGPRVISPAEIKAAAKSVVAEAVQDEPTETPPNAPTGMSSSTWVVILLAVIIVGGVLYLADQNDSEHGGEGIFKRNARQRADSVQQYRHPFLRQQWQVRP